ncbi:BZ3500_MvSof-1268-A1-R1_Chr5-2g07773 [Microbotryum saponariae]|uniref:BZ3500_MvSof-1268-A1-R1_Chr5-2g07773 protein n=1 Tax=Microbotryum saponariae TaxID=289078 RepID=A0A2X0MJ88_9BASI|nr:BZ3500_MvSof-1268-A1-R1_Chr5-2g07773 [Microbotryum saponariae]SDA05642.1 BZ3501_MvSof-1269-A2-R1_Chr5-2g07595 [Microbotryum saponariae]
MFKIPNEGGRVGAFPAVTLILEPGTWNRTGSVAAATSSPPASTSSQGSGIGSSRDTPDSATQSRADKRRFNELLNDGQDSTPNAINQLGKKPLGRPPHPPPAFAPAPKRARGRPRKTDEEKEKTAKAQAKQAEEKAAKKGQDEEQARQREEAKRSRLEVERAPQRQIVLDEQTQRMLFPPAKTYTVSFVDQCLVRGPHKVLRISMAINSRNRQLSAFAQASSLSSSSASNPSFAVPSGSGAPHSTDPNLPSMPVSANSAVPPGGGSKPLKWSPRNLLHKNMGRTLQQMQTQLPADRKLRHTWLAKRQGIRFAVLHVHTPIERALYKHIFSWGTRWTSLGNAQATMNLAENDVKATQAMITDPSPLLGHKPPVSGMLTDAEVEASNPQTSFIRPSGAMDTNNNGPCAGIATSGSSVSVVTGKVMRRCRFCGQASCKFKGSASARQGSEILCENPCVDCGKMYGLSEERDPNNPESPRFCKGLTTAEMGGRARYKKKCHNHKPL